MASPRNRKRRRRSGVPVIIAILLILLALVVGTLIGYVIRDRLGPQDLSEIIGLGVPADEDGLPVEPLDPETAAGLLSGDNEIAPLSEAANPRLDAEAELSAAETEPVVVAEYDGGQVLSSEVIDAYNEAVNASLLENFTVPEDADALLEETLNRVVDDKIALAKAEALGLNGLTEADAREIDSRAEAIYADRLSELLPENADEAARAEAARKLEEGEGVTVQSISDALKKDFWRQKLFDSVTAQVEVTDEDLAAAYDALLAAQKAQFEASTDEYDYARLTGETIVYNPEGYRVVRQIFFAPDAEAQARCVALTDERSELDPYGDAERIAEIDAALAEIYAPLEEAAAAAQARVAAGERFEAVAREYGGAEECWVGPNTVRWSEAFTQAALALAKPDDVSEPVRSVSGVHLIQYVRDVEAGEVPLEDVRDSLTAGLLSERRGEAYAAQQAAWREELNARLYPERLQ